MTVYDDYVSADEAACIMGVSGALMRHYLRRNVFRTARKLRGTTWQVSRSEVERAKRENWDLSERRR